MWISQNPYKSVHFAELSPEKDCNPLEFASSKFHKVQCITMNEYVCQSFLIYQGTRSMGPVGGEPCEETSSVNPTILALTELSSLVGCRMLYMYCICDVGQKQIKVFTVMHCYVPLASAPIRDLVATPGDRGATVCRFSQEVAWLEYRNNDR